MSVKKIMSANIVTVSMDDTINVVYDIFSNLNFHHLLVVNQDTLYGVVSDRDLLKATSPYIGTNIESDKDLATLNKKVHQIMSRKPITLSINADAYEAIEVFNNYNVSCIPIVDENNKAIGIVTWRDILKYIKQK